MNECTYLIILNFAPLRVIILVISVVARRISIHVFFFECSESGEEGEKSAHNSVLGVLAF